MAKNLDNMSVEELTVELEKCNEERLAAKEKGAKVKEVLHNRLMEDHAAEYGLTVEEYLEVKTKADPTVEIEAQLDASLAKSLRLRERSKDDRKTKEMRASAKEEADELDEEIEALRARLEEERQNVIPLAAALKMAAKEKITGRKVSEKEVQTVKVKSKVNMVKAKSKRKLSDEGDD